MRLTIVLLVVVLPLVIVALSVVFLREPLQRRWYSGTGIQEWSSRAAELSWADRFALYRANNRGRAVQPRLAQLAVERGEVMLRVLDRTLERGSAWRRLRILLLVVYGLNVVLAAVRIATEGGGSGWFMLAAWSTCLGLYLVHPVLLRRGERRLRRSVDLNRQLLADSR